MNNNENKDSLEVKCECASEVQEGDNEDLIEDFIVEAKEHLTKIEAGLIALEKKPNNTDILLEIARDYHSLKGLAGFAGQSLIQTIVHNVENLLEDCKKNVIVVDKTLIGLLIKSIDVINNLCSNCDLSTQAKYLRNIDEFFHQIENFEQAPPTIVAAEKAEEEVIEEEEEEIDAEFLEDFIVEAQEHLETIETNVLILEKEPHNAEIIHGMFRSFHTIKGLAGFVNQHLIQKTAHQTETLMDEFRKGNIEVNKNIIDLILTSADLIKKICKNIYIAKDKSFVEIVDAHLKALNNSESFVKQKNAPIATQKQATATEEKPKEQIEVKIQEALPINPQHSIIKEEKPIEEPKPLPKTSQPVVAETVKPIETPKPLQQTQTPQAQTQQQQEEYMRIATSRIDNLVDMIGELIISQSLIEQESAKLFNNNDSYAKNISRMSRITKDIQTLSMQLRMVSLKSTFRKITRIARDTINEQKKDIEFTTYGDDTEIDRVITERLLDPLVHLVKNSISHGIESKEERESTDKPFKGKVSVSASNKKGNIYIEIKDDGKGIDLKKVYSKAIEKGLIDPGKEYTPKEIQEFIMLPGFSTLEKATNISGRGIGMDVVKTEILRMGGRIEIFNTPGAGCSFVLKIPVNHAI